MSILSDFLPKVHRWIQRRERAKAARARIARAIDCLQVRRSQEIPPTMPEPFCGHSSHEYNPWAERHECCESRRCRCRCEGARQREERYASAARRLGLADVPIRPLGMKGGAQ